MALREAPELVSTGMSADCRLYCDFHRHPRTLLLRRRLGANAVLALQQLWCAAAESYPSGAFSGKSDEELAILAGWIGDPCVLIPTLREVGFLDGREGDTQIHNWEKRQPWVTERAKRAAKSTKAAKVRWEKQRQNEQREELLRIALTKGTHTDREWRELRAICGWVCARCKQERQLTKDHIVPLISVNDPRASDSIFNLQPLCGPCNSIKGADVIDWRPPNWEKLLHEQLANAPGNAPGNAAGMLRALPPTQPKVIEDLKSKGHVAPLPVESVEVVEKPRPFIARAAKGSA